MFETFFSLKKNRKVVYCSKQIISTETNNQKLKIALVGRPNVGKSTLVNQLLGEDRVLTGPEAGITRDAISVNWQYGDRVIKLTDTAGLRRKSKVTNKIENLSTLDSFRAIQYAQIVILVVVSY